MDRFEKATDEMKDQMSKMMEMMAKFVKEKGKETLEVSESETTHVYPPGFEPKLGLPSGLEHNTISSMLPQCTFQPSGSYSFVPQSSPLYGFQQPRLASSSKPIVISAKEKGNGLGNAGDQQVLNNINEKLQELEGISTYGSVDVFELTLVEGLVVPPKFKVPEFEKYDATKCPREHLISYTRKMATYKDNEKMMIHIFQYSLTGSAGKWYNRLDRHHIRSWQDLGKAFITQFKHMSELVPDRWSLQAMERNLTEIITEYDQRWRDAASQVIPAISDKEQAMLFINTFKPPYYGYLLSGMTKDFVDLVVLGEMIDISIKNGKLEGGESASTKKNQWTKKKEGEVQATFNRSNQYLRPYLAY
ncbi:Retrotransposon gag protein [Corchorus olitorius]|uniref:Retrotransposon gag protein n=1 Tax=Corchorus olitorius TaxID=93759 RepID=A0A1R3I3Y5_9ROSI|nr:Retrotransposon gag protein [Corchorus olitorius]